MSGACKSSNAATSVMKPVMCRNIKMGGTIDSEGQMDHAKLKSKHSPMDIFHKLLRSACTLHIQQHV